MWKDRPWVLEYWPENIDYIMFLDENNTPDLKDIKKRLSRGQQIDINKRYFTITGCILKREHFPDTRKNIIAIKESYWQNGLFYYEKPGKNQKVCFHSNEIRNGRGPFSPDIINREDFLTDLNRFVVETDYTIMSATLDKVQHVQTYTYPAHPYDLCLVFILERFAKFFLYNRDKTGIIILEARGQKEDRFTLKNIVQMLEQGTTYCNPRQYGSIKGVYFNPKWCEKDDNQTSYFGLELADLVSYPIYKYWRTGVEDRALQNYKHKIYGYPQNMNWGLKIFP